MLISSTSTTYMLVIVSPNINENIFRLVKKNSFAKNKLIDSKFVTLGFEKGEQVVI